MWVFSHEGRREVWRRLTREDIIFIIGRGKRNFDLLVKKKKSWKTYLYKPKLKGHVIIFKFLVWNSNFILQKIFELLVQFTRITHSLRKKNYPKVLTRKNIQSFYLKFRITRSIRKKFIRNVRFSNYSSNFTFAKKFYIAKIFIRISNSVWLYESIFTKNTRKIREKYVNYYHSRIIRELFAKNLIYNVIQKFN